MSIKFKLKSLLAPVAVAAAAACIPTVASADAVAQSYLFLKNFTFTVAPAGAITTITATDSGDVSASIYGGAPATDNFNSGSAAGDFTLQESVGPDAGTYVPGTAIVAAPTQNFVGSYAAIRDMANNPAVIGDPFTGNVFAGVDNTVSLTPGGVGTAQSNTNLASTFTIDVLAGTVLGVNFTADAFLRAALAPLFAPGSANASYEWSISLALLDPVAGTSTEVFEWAPDGDIDNTTDDITGGTELFDAFSLTDSVGLTLGGFQDTTGVLTGFFSAVTDPLTAGLYQVNITHLANADASIVVAVPEPGALALVSVALLGLGVASRRRRQS